MIFYKTSCGGNEFLHVPCQGAELIPARRLEIARKLCQPIGGIGADGVVFFRQRHDAIDCHIHNRDGSEAELSGNGIAGLSSVLFARSTAQKVLHLKTVAGLKRVELLDKQGNVFHLRVEIGAPDFNNHAFFPFLQKGVAEYSMQGMHFHPVSVGNPHIVLLLEKAWTLAQCLARGKILERAKLFPQRTNIEFVFFRHAGDCRVVFYERGVGRTLFSATGSAALFAVLRQTGRIDAELFLDTADNRIRISGRKKIYIENFSRLLCWGHFRL